MITAKDIAKQILALPEEQQNVPLVYEYYDDAESSVPVAAKMESIRFYESGYPTTEPHIQLNS